MGQREPGRRGPTGTFSGLVGGPLLLLLLPRRRRRRDVLMLLLFLLAQRGVLAGAVVDDVPTSS